MKAKEYLEKVCEDDNMVSEDSYSNEDVLEKTIRQCISNKLKFSQELDDLYVDE